MGKKTVSDRVLDANRKNSKKSTGPRTDAGKRRARFNSRKHGLLSKGLHFVDDDSRKAYESLFEGLLRDAAPGTLQELLIVEEIATQFWRLAECSRWTDSAIRARRPASLAALHAFAANGSEAVDPCAQALQQSDNGTHLADGFECTELSVTGCAGTNESQGSGEFSRKERNHGEAIMRLRLSSSLETFLRYQTTIKRDLHRAIDQLQRLQGKGE